MMPRRILLHTLFALATCLAACRPHAPSDLDHTGFENPIGAAVIEQMLQESAAAYPDEEEGIPFCVVVGERLQPASAAFTKRFEDQGYPFIDYQELDYDRVTKATVIKGTRTNPIILQLVKMSEPRSGVYEVVAAWNRDSDVVRKRYEVTPSDGDGAPTVKELDAPRGPES